MNIIKEANNTFNQRIIENTFIECLKEKGYYKINVDYKDLFLKCLVKKGYLPQERYNDIICEINNIKHVNVRTNHKKKEKRITFKEETDTYAIENKDFIDYESVHIEGIEYYFKASNLKVAENIHFTDTGIWNCDTQRIEFTKDEDRVIHIGRVESIGGSSNY